MNLEETLFDFEKKYSFLYEIEINGVPVYTCFRDAIVLILTGEKQEKHISIEQEKGRIYPKRILESIIKLRKFKKAQTLVFTSSMFRRDYGRNLAAEYLMDKYPDTVVFEWPSRTDVYDAAYFDDPHRERYCPLEFYLFLYKIYIRMHKRAMASLEEKCRDCLRQGFLNSVSPNSIYEQQAIDLLIREMPVSYASTAISQQVFRRLFRKYENIKYAIDFWGSGRENIIPVLPGDFEAVELQHGIITEFHPGYIYPKGANDRCKRFFDRTMLVYGEATKKLLIDRSVFTEKQIQVIGNPRIKKYKEEFGESKKDRCYILFTSQPFEQDVKGSNYYSEIIPYLQDIQKQIAENEKWKQFRLAIKLHPRENNAIKKKYEESIPGCEVFDNATQLYELLGKSFLHVTVSSTTLYEAALFDTPTVLVSYKEYIDKEIYGFEIKHYRGSLPEDLLVEEKYKTYLMYLKIETLKYM